MDTKINWRRKLGLAAALTLGVFVSLAARPDAPKSDAVRYKPEVALIPPVPSGGIELTMTSNDAVQIAKQFQDMLGPDVAPFVYFVWNRTGDRKVTQAVSLMLNSSFASRHSDPVIINELAGGKVLWFNLKLYASTEQDQVDFINVWRNLEFDPDFSQLITKDEVNASIRAGLPLPIVPANVQKTVAKVIKGGVRHETRDIYCPLGLFRYPDNSGRTWRVTKADNYRFDLEYHTTDTVEVKRIENVIDLLDTDAFDVIRFNSPGIDPTAYGELQNRALTNAVIVDAGYANFRLTHTVKNDIINRKKEDGLYSVLWGGLYYEAINVRLAKDVKFKDGKTAAEHGKTDLDVFLNDQGVLQLDSDENFDTLQDRLRADQRGIIWKSGVTKKIRRWDIINGTAGKTGSNVVISITHDIDKKNKDIARNAFFNTFTFKDDAREVIFPTRSGFHGFALFNGEGARQDVVPQGVAIHEELHDGSGELQPSASCIMCHGGDKMDGLQPLTNDFKDLLAPYITKYKVEGKRVAVRGAKTDLLFDQDLANLGKGLDNQYDRFKGLYMGDPLLYLLTSRDSYALAFSLGAKWTAADISENNVEIAVGRKFPVPQAIPYIRMGSERMADVDRAYWYNDVGAVTALATWGITVRADKAVNVYNEIISPATLPPGVTLPAIVTLSAIAKGQQVGRNEWALAQAYGAISAQQWRDKHKEQK